MKGPIITIFVISVIVLILLWFSQANFDETTQYQDEKLQCAGLSDSEIRDLIDSFMQRKNYKDFEIITISPLYCSSGFGLYNILVEVTIDKYLPTEHKKSLRLQIRTDVSGSRIYEVVLTRQV